jgi:anthranilate phosphoribosyltransferase
MNLSDYFEQIIRGEHLNKEQMQNIMQNCLEGQLSTAQLASFLALMRMKGETIDELTTAAQVMKHHAHTIDLGDDLVDIVGTGGDGRNTFNISTFTSFVTAGAGVRVAKHGNHSVSSKSGSADLLIAAGFELILSDDAIQHCIDKSGMTFLFAPRFHQAMRHAKEARSELKIKTLFNLLGPLLNPAGVKQQVVGVFHKKWMRPVAEVLVNLGSQHTLVVHSRDGLDEASVADITDVIEYSDGQFKDWGIDPSEHGCYHASLDDLIVESPAESLALGLSVLEGSQGPARDIASLNAALALLAANKCNTLDEGLTLAHTSIDSGEALKRFHLLRDLTQRYKND